MINRVMILGLLFLSCGALATATGAAADVAGGQALARTWCANCHVVDGRPGATDAAPPFREIADHADLGRERLRVWLSTPHDRMPNLGLGRNDIDSLIDYLQSLRN